jgi:molecular chaperone DnaK (HSP70)
MAEYHRVIGIDLGTTFSVVAAYSYDKKDVKVIPNRQNEPTTPSVVYVAPDGRVSVGKAAKEKLARDPNRVISEVKRLMGEQQGGRKAMAHGAGFELDPEVISAHVLKELKACAEKVIGEPIHDAVITVPARFKEPQKNATREAAKIAKLNPRLIINEPTAAAVAYGLDTGEPQTFVVFDFGGGTFDVSVVRIMEDQTVEILGTGGDPHLGGGDIDQKIVDWALSKMKAQYGEDFRGNARLIGRLKLKAEQVKIHLCNERQRQDFFLEFPTPEIDEINYSLTPADFESMLQPLLARAMDEVEVALDSARDRHDLTLDDVDAFILVGGSSRIPQVAEALAARYKKPIKANLNPDEIVAMGAARMALNFEPSLEWVGQDDIPLRIDADAVRPPEELVDTNIKDVVSHTLGIGLKDDIYDPLIPKDHVIPHKVIRGGYATAQDNQTSIYVPVYQGDNPKASLNFLLGDVVIDNLAPGPKGSHQFQVTFALDADGIFVGELLHQQTGTLTPITLSRGQGAMTEKKRIALADIVESGMIGPGPAAPGGAAVAGSAPEASDPVVQLVEEANRLLPNLPSDRQREMNDVLGRLHGARATNDTRKVAVLVAQLTMLLVRGRGN